MSTGVVADERMRRRTVLVVEDNEINRMMLVSFLQTDYNVLTAADGLEGLQKLADYHQDISMVLLDVYMPRCDGFEFLRRKSQDERFDVIPVIVTTAGGSEDDEVRCLELGANDFVLKPYNFRIIKNRMTNLIRLRESAAIVNKLTWDTETDLYIKEFFYRAAEDVFSQLPDEQFDLFVCKVENYPSLTNRYGDAKCVRMLREIAHILSKRFSRRIAAGRIAQDTFAFVVLHEGHIEEDLLSVNLEELSLPNAVVKFGVVENADTAIALPKLCNLGISAASTIADRYDSCVALFDDELHERQLLEETIREGMEVALRGMEFSVFYQPKHDVRTGNVGGAEALVRWFHPTVGFISPGLFIPIFERNGFITRLDEFVWEQACMEVSRCEKLGLPRIPISVNVSRIDFDLPDLPQRLSRLVQKHDVDPGLLHVELTETAYSDNPQKVVTTLAELKGLGFSIELDDFGSGYSSLVSLNTLPLDVMKLDMSMVRKATELNDFRIVESTINLAQVLGLKTVVEGVETADEARRVTEIGCDYIQGYYYSRPLRRSEFEDYLRNDGLGEA